MKIAIAGATGNIGKRVAQQVSRAGATAVLLGQNLERLKQLHINGSIAEVADLSDQKAVVSATVGVEALLWLVPPIVTGESLSKWYALVTNAGVEAVKKNNIKRVVVISTLGAGAASNLGTVTFGGRMEVAFDQLQANVVALRPGYFMENLLLQASSFQEEDAFRFPFDANHDIPFISADDIGDAAAKFLLDRSWAGHWKKNLMGPENITPLQMAERLSIGLNRKISYIQQSSSELCDEVKSWGVNEVVLRELLDLYAALGDPNGAYATPRTPEANTETSLEDFISRKLLLNVIA